jgi:hypothetical protein
MKIWPLVAVTALSLTLVACKSPTPPKGVKPVTGFDAQRYLGKWYEIARLDHRFERGKDHVTATYKKRSDGGLVVINRGYDPEKKSWSESEGKAYFTGRSRLNVTTLILPESWALPPINSSGSINPDKHVSPRGGLRLPYVYGNLGAPFCPVRRNLICIQMTLCTA